MSSPLPAVATSRVLWQQLASSNSVDSISAPIDIVNHLAAATLQTHTANPTLEITSADPQKVTAALQAKIGASMPFPVMLPKVSADFHLLGGSIVTIGTGPAVYTSWEAKGRRYSLFQLPPANVNMPPEFMKQEALPSHDLPALASYSIALWPGTPHGICTWVAIGERNALHEPFSVSAY